MLICNGGKMNFLKNKNARKYILAFFTVVILIVTYVYINSTGLVSVYSLQAKVEEQVENMDIILGGDIVGIKLLATGVLVMSIDRDDNIDLKVGDVILEVNDEKVDTDTRLSEIAKMSGGNDLKLKVSRGEDSFYTYITPIKEDSDEYKLGLWVKDSSAGIGTITFYDKKTMKFAALGHGVTETKENYILPIDSGAITTTKVTGLKKGESRSPGELKGTLTNDLIGQIYGNTDKGIYGKIEVEDYFLDKQSIKIMKKTEIKENAAQIYCTLDDNIIQSYDIYIEKVLLTSTGNKNMIIKITDERLLEKTGGIVQGMSGSPIVQDGKLVGAVTHVLLNDPTRGYGVFIENMIDDLNSIE